MSPPGPFRQTTQMVSIKLCPPKPVYLVSLYFHFSCICICIRICIRVTVPFFLLASPTTRLKCSVQIIQFYQCPPQLLYYCILYSLRLYLYFFLSVFVFLYVSPLTQLKSVLSGPCCSQHQLVFFFLFKHKHKVCMYDVIPKYQLQNRENVLPCCQLFVIASSLDFFSFKTFI